jgi:DNA-binding transcriptional ArsR family regulator
MDDEPDISQIAAMLGDPSRAKICLALCDGRPLPAGELALRACVSAQTASNHLAKLRARGLIAVEATSRCRYYRLATPEVARAIEALALVAPVRRSTTSSVAKANALRAARTCYDHLAGLLGVRLTTAMEERRWLQRSGTNFIVTEEGQRGLVDFGIDLGSVRRARRAFALVCVDWSERRPHLAGGLGAAVLARLLSLKWLERLPRTRAVRLTAAGWIGLRDQFGFTMPSEMDK